MRAFLILVALAFAGCDPALGSDTMLACKATCSPGPVRVVKWNLCECEPTIPTAPDGGVR